MDSRRRLRNLLVDPGFQLRYIFWIPFTGAIVIVLYSVIIYAQFAQNALQAVDPHQAHLFLSEILFKLFFVAITFLIMITGVVFVLSHRTAGALYRYKETFKAIKEGQTEARIQLRKNDEFQPVAAAFNDMMDHLTQQKS